MTLHLVVVNSVDGKEIGDAKVDVDDLIDIKLRDLAKEYCVCLNRSHIIQQEKDQLLGQGKTPEDVRKKFEMHT
jgi:hypothetical protein